MKAMKAPGLDDDSEGILIALGMHDRFIRPVVSRPGLFSSRPGLFFSASMSAFLSAFMYAALASARVKLALSSRKVLDVQGGLRL